MTHDIQRLFAIWRRSNPSQILTLEDAFTAGAQSIIGKEEIRTEKVVREYTHGVLDTCTTNSLIAALITADTNGDQTQQVRILVDAKLYLVHTVTANWRGNRTLVICQPDTQETNHG